MLRKKHMEGALDLSLLFSRGQRKELWFIRLNKSLESVYIFIAWIIFE